MTRKHTLSAGEYWIGDPCYAIADENWMDLLDKTGYFGLPDYVSEDYDDGLFHYGDKEAFGGGTHSGDGCYRGTDGFGYGVDAGLLSIIPLSVCDGDSMYGGNIVTFKEDFDVWIDKGREKTVFHFGHIIIKT